MMTASTTNSVPGPFAHLALPYRGDTEYLAGAVPFIMKGLASDEPVLVAVPTRRLALLRAELGPTADDVTLVDMTDVGRNPGRIIPGVLLPFADTHPQRQVRIVAESIWPDRRPDEYVECVRHEALLNRALTGRCTTVLCPVDVLGLPTRAHIDSARTHPMTVYRNGTRPSVRYAPDEAIEAADVELAPPPDACRYVVDTPDMIELRSVVATYAQDNGLGGRRVQDLVLALTELASNSIEHAHSAATVLFGRIGDRLVCQVRDSGHIGDPMAGRRPVPPSQLRGRGLLLVNELADLARVHTTQAGTTVEMQFEVPG